MGNCLNRVATRITENRPLTTDNERTANNDISIECINLAGTRFMDLNDDCLREILTLLTVMDLSSLLELSKILKNTRLKEITNEIFKRNHRFCNINYEVNSVYQEACRLIINFGPLLSELIVKCTGEGSIDIMKLVIRFCSKTLQRIELHDFYFDDSVTEVVFHKLESLSIENCSFKGNNTDLFANCSSLTYLWIFDTPVNEAILQQTFPNLEIFITERNGEICKDFILRHKKLKTLGLTISNHSILLPVIADNCKELKVFLVFNDILENEIDAKLFTSFQHLEKLRLDVRPNALIFARELNHLQSLKVLILGSISFDDGVLSALIQLKCLEELRLCECKEFSDSNSLVELCRLKKLVVTSAVNIDFNLVYIVCGLTELEKLCLQFPINLTIDERMYSRIANARSKAGSARPILQIECGEIKTIFPRNIN